MSKVNYTPDNALEYPNGPHAQSCGSALFYHRYGAVYEVQPNGKVAWWTHGVGAGAKVYDPPGQCNCLPIGEDPFGNVMQACGPQPHAPNSMDYVGSNGNTHYFVAWGSRTPPTQYLLTDG